MRTRTYGGTALFLGAGVLAPAGALIYVLVGCRIPGLAAPAR